jgi:TetR/AcrR family transcriptional regulator, transcriptional repressor for nem operon
MATTCPILLPCNTRTECDELAGFLIASLQGAILQLKTERSAAPTERFKHLNFSTLLRT